MNPKKETEKRLSIAYEESERLKEKALGIILAGSVVYSPNYKVNDKSDIDLMVVVDNLKDNIESFVEDGASVDKLKNRFFDGYCLKEEKDGVPISTHLISNDAFDIINKCFVANLRVYRPDAKEGTYNLFSFERDKYPYTIKNIDLKEMEKGVRTIMPISFINNDRYFIGIHRDKLLSNPRILYDTNKIISKGIEKVWKVVTQNLLDESMRLYGKLDLSKRNVLNCLAKKENMTRSVKESIEGKTDFYLSKMIR